MNLKTEIYDSIISAATQILEDNIEPSSLKNSQFEVYAKQYADNLLLKTFHCPNEEYKTPEFLIRNTFTAGFFCQMLDTLSDKDDFEKTEFITSVLSNVYSLQGKMIGLLLNSDSECIKEHYENIMELLVIEFCQYLTYQNIDEAPLNHMYTVYATLFLIGCSINIDYKIA